VYVACSFRICLLVVSCQFCAPNPAEGRRGRSKLFVYLKKMLIVYSNIYIYIIYIYMQYVYL
jgi:hypothetical protein